MSRAAAFRQFTQEDLAAVLRENGVELLFRRSGRIAHGLQGYRAVMKAQQDLVDILAVFHPVWSKGKKRSPASKGR